MPSCGLLALGLIIAGCSHGPHGPPAQFAKTPGAVPSAPKTPEDKIVASLEAQVASGTRYDGAYLKLAYPGGDVPADQGVCTDVVIRAYRAAGYDLQQLVYEDAKADIRRYPRIGSADKLDPNIDHRRCPNLVAYLEAHADEPSDWEPGDIVFWKLPGNRDHVGMVGTRAAADGTPLMIHNIPNNIREDNALLAWPMAGHYRWKPWQKKSSDR